MPRAGGLRRVEGVALGLRPGDARGYLRSAHAAPRTPSRPPGVVNVECTPDSIRSGPGRRLRAGSAQERAHRRGDQGAGRIGEAPAQRAGTTALREEAP